MELLLYIMFIITFYAATVGLAIYAAKLLTNDDVSGCLLFWIMFMSLLPVITIPVSVLWCLIHWFENSSFIEKVLDRINGVDND